MNAQDIVNLFATSLSPDPNVRKAGEIEIRRIGGQEGALTALMQVIGNQHVDIAVRQATSVFLKNRIIRAWYIDPDIPKPDTAPIADSDRVFVKQNILSLLVAAQSRPSQVQLAAAFKAILTHDFPDKWPGIVDDVLALLQSGNSASVYGACIALLEVIRSTRFRTDRKIMHGIVEKTFPTLVQVGTEIGNHFTPENAEGMHIILKSYKASTQTSLSPHQQSPESIMPWGKLFFQIINARLVAPLPGTPYEWETSGWWKAKKWAFNTLDRLFDRYGSPSQLPEAFKKDVKAFAEQFVTSFAPEIFKVYLQQVESYAKGEQWLSAKCKIAILRFFTACVKPRATWDFLKPHVQTLVASFVFPELKFTQERHELWQSDPLEYVRRSVELDDAAEPSAAGTTFLIQLARSRGKSTFMTLLSLINNVLSGNAPEDQRYGALIMTSSLSGVIMRHPTVKNEMEQFCVKFVLPGLSSDHGFIRESAAEVLGGLERFGLVWSNPANLEAHYLAIGKVIEDPDLPVRIPAVICLTHMLRHDLVKTALIPNIDKVMQILFSLSDETDLDVTTEALETFIDNFQPQLAPAAVQIITRLAQSYVRVMGEYVAIQESSLRDDLASSIAVEDDKTMALTGIARAIETVLDSLDALEDSKEIVANCQEVVIPIINLTLEKQVVEAFDSVFSLVDTFTFTLRQITPNMWSVFEHIYKVFKEVAIDYLDEMIPGLDNFIDFGKDVFAQSPEYRRMVIDVFVSALTHPSLGDADHVHGCALGECILLNMRGHIDQELEGIIKSAIDIFSKNIDLPALRVGALNLLVNTILYNPPLALRIMDANHPGFAATFFTKWFEAIKKGNLGLPRVHDKRLSVIALSELLRMNAADVPASLRSGWPGIVGAALAIFKDLPAAIESKAHRFSQVEPADAEDEGSVPCIRSALSILTTHMADDKDVWDDEDQYLQMIADEKERLDGIRAANAESSVADDVDDVDGYSIADEVEEELHVERSIDGVNAYISFKSALTSFETANPEAYAAATASLTGEEQTILIDVMTKAQEAEVAKSTIKS
ncbi:armadillo-type protein [Cantharellus anzutake]|uniref:armadillo-type protein n=1 Tax=Cantharellus anzutake TaxID=1750568 RepID=UPI0019067FD8|nr:armadillo-type protein [Cantharellus anzutake]KAF8327473.1 armadillo-type protein [Cantharellus anzutake]